MAIGGMKHEKLPPGAQVYVRDTGAPIRTVEEELYSPEFIAKGMIQLREALQDLARRSENHAHPVDEYNTCPLGGTSSVNALTLQPTYELMPEKILSILVAGPPAAAVTIQLGDRFWSVNIPPSGIMSIGPVALILGRSDTRQQSSQTAGMFFLELMGFADARFAA